MKLYLFTSFAKRKNSTLQPTLSQASASYDVYLKIDTDYDAPIFEIRDASKPLPVYTYAYLQDINRYYFVAACKQRNANCWEIVCELDERATYKAIILGTTAFVAFSSSDYNPLLNDNRVAKTNEVRVYEDNRNTVFGSNKYDFLWVAGEGGIVPYVCNVRTITQAIYQAANQDLLDNLCQTWSDIQSCILYARTFGLDSTPSGTSETIKIGKYDVGHQGVRISDANLCYTSPDLSITIGGTYRDFRRFAFTEMKLSLPYVGVTALSIADFVTDPTVAGHVNINYTVNFASGVVTYKITNDDGGVVAVFNGVAGRAKPVSIYSPYSGVGVLTGGGGALAASAALMFATGPVGIVAGAAGAIAGVASMFNATQESTGATVGTNDGSCEEIINPSIVLTVEEYGSNIEPDNLTAVSGRPCGKVRSLAGLTGYVQTSGASVTVNANSNVIDNLNAALDAGLYIE